MVLPAHARAGRIPPPSTPDRWRKPVCRCGQPGPELDVRWWASGLPRLVATVTPRHVALQINAAAVKELVCEADEGVNELNGVKAFAASLPAAPPTTAYGSRMRE